jgi:hypothetical protein
MRSRMAASVVVARDEMEVGMAFSSLSFSHY